MHMRRCKHCLAPQRHQHQQAVFTAVTDLKAQMITAALAANLLWSNHKPTIQYFLSRGQIRQYKLPGANLSSRATDAYLRTFETVLDYQAAVQNALCSHKSRDLQNNGRFILNLIVNQLTTVHKAYWKMRQLYLEHMSAFTGSIRERA